MAGLIAPVARLIDEFNKLPGVGRKTAQRLTYFVLRAPADDARALAAALVAATEEVAYRSTCCNITDILADLLTPHVPVVSRIARGLPVGGDLEYADDVTLIRSLQGRRQVERG